MADIQTFTRAARANFLRGIAMANDDWRNVVEVVNSDFVDETYDSFTPAPAVQEITTESHNPRTGIRFNFTITNRTWATSIEVGMDALEDDRIGAFNNQIANMGRKMRNEMFRQAMTRLFQGDVNPSYDGSNFFANAHNDWTGDNALSTAVAAGDAVPSLSELEVAFNDMRASLQEFNDAEGDPITFDTSQDLWIVGGPRLETVISRMLTLQLRTAGEDQIFKGAARMLVTPHNEDTAIQKEIILVKADPLTRPLILQERSAIKEVVEERKKDRVIFFGAEQRFEVGLKDAFSAVKQDFTT